MHQIQKKFLLCLNALQFVCLTWKTRLSCDALQFACSSLWHWGGKGGGGGGDSAEPPVRNVGVLGELSGGNRSRAGASH